VTAAPKGVADLRDDDRVRLYPNASNPLHKQPVEATFSGGYFYCDNTDPADGPDYYFGDVLTFNDRIEVLA
jgi:hypothetical protein